MGICKLCLQDKELIKKSHIIPEFMYKELYDEKHKLRLFDPKSLFEGESHLKKPSTGIYEGDLLCAVCDNKIIGSLESYGYQILYADELPDEIRPKCKNYRNQDGLEFSICENVNYSKIKLFILSILWRASISSNEIFNGISLGKDENEIRQMILNNSPDSQSKYPIIIASWIRDETFSNDIISQPSLGVLEGKERFVFPINGFIYNIYLDYNDIQPALKNFIIKESNEISILHMPNGMARDFLLKYHNLK